MFHALKMQEPSLKDQDTLIEQSLCYEMFYVGSGNYACWHNFEHNDVVKELGIIEAFWSASRA